MAVRADAAPLDPVVPVLPEAAEPYLLPVPAGAVKVLPRWSEEDGVIRWRLRYRARMPEESEDLTGIEGTGPDGFAWVELELRPFTRELPLTGLSHGRQHYFRVAIETPDGWSNWCRIVSCVPPSPELPGKLSTVYVMVKDSSAVLVRWTRPIDYAASVSCGHIIRYKLLVTWKPLSPSEDPTQLYREIIIDDDAECCEVADLQCLRDYQFQVAAENVTGWGDLSDPSPVVNVPAPVPPKLPMPTLRRATHHSVVIQWVSPPSCEVPIDSFRFRYSTNEDDSLESWRSSDVQEIRDVSAHLSQYVIDGLGPGTTYLFQVTALNKFGMGIWSDSSITVRTSDGQTPSQIGGFSVPHIYKSFITLQWIPAQNNGHEVTHHYLRYTSNEEMRDAVEVEPVVVRKDGTDRCDLRHLKKTIYFFQVAAFNKLGMSEWSDKVAVNLTETARLEDAK